MGKVGRWKKGESGNPAGRPKLHPEVTELAKQETPAAFKRIINLAKNAEDDGTQLRANQYIIDRAYGKPAQAVDLSSKDGTGFHVTVQIVEKGAACAEPSPET